MRRKLYIAIRHYFQDLAQQLEEGGKGIQKHRNIFFLYREIYLVRMPAFLSLHGPGRRRGGAGEARRRPRTPLLFVEHLPMFRAGRIFSVVFVPVVASGLNAQPRQTPKIYKNKLFNNLKI